MKPPVSVALTTFNGERFIDEQLRSIAAQEPPPSELVIGDDGSTDRTLARIESSLAGATFPVRVLSGGHVGLRRNVERVIEACRAPVIALSDQDDVWLPGRLASISDAFADPAVTLWHSDADLIDEEGQSLDARLWDRIGLTPATRQSISDGTALRRLLYGMTVTGATMAFRSSIRAAVLPLPDELEGSDHLFLHDGWIAVIAALLGTVVPDERVFTLYRQHPTQFTNMQVVNDAAPVGRRRPASASDLVDEHRRVDLVLTRLRQTGLLDRCRPTDRQLLIGLERLLRTRSGAPGLARTRAIVVAWRAGDYGTYARGWRTAVGDLLYPRAR
jgi:glycosyltransferase involved in cell wall biosynthesis